MLTRRTHFLPCIDTYVGPHPSTLYFCAGFDREGKRVVRVQNPRSAFFCKDPLLADYLSLRATLS
jgi:hypothetical protein